MDEKGMKSKSSSYGSVHSAAVAAQVALRRISQIGSKRYHVLSKNHLGSRGLDSYKHDRLFSIQWTLHHVSVKAVCFTGVSSDALTFFFFLGRKSSAYPLFLFRVLHIVNSKNHARNSLFMTHLATAQSPFPVDRLFRYRFVPTKINSQFSRKNHKIAGGTGICSSSNCLYILLA